MKVKLLQTLAVSLFVLTLTNMSIASAGKNGGCKEDCNDDVIELTLIHMGDVHGHLIPRPHLRSDGYGELQGGLARLYSKIKKIREHSENSLLINTGDTIQGSAEALYTRGQALVDVINEFDIDYFAPGNWEFVYGTERFQELFSGSDAVAPWGALAANLYFDGAPYKDKSGQRVLPPYTITEVDGVKIGILGFTTERGPKVIGADVVQGFRFSKGDAEMAEFVPLLRSKVDVLLVISELGLANNIRLAEANPGIDIILSSDMHEETAEPVFTSTGTLIIEEGQDGTRLGELKLTIKDGRLKNTDFIMHTIDSNIKQDKGIARKVAAVRKPFVKGAFRPHLNPVNGTTLSTPIDTIIGQADIALHRSNFAHEKMPAVIEGSSHNFLSDVFKEMTHSDIGIIRGFRYGTHIAPGPIKLEDIYHYVAIGPFIAKGEVTGQQMKNVIENTTDGSLNSDPAKWRGGWLFGWSGLTYDLDPYGVFGSRATNIMIHDYETDNWAPLDLLATYSLGGYNYDSEPNLINKIPSQNVIQYTDENGNAVEGTQVIVDYLKTRSANPVLNRINILSPLPAPKFGNYEIQPLQGATP